MDGGESGVAGLGVPGDEFIEFDEERVGVARAGGGLRVILHGEDGERPMP